MILKRRNLAMTLQLTLEEAKKRALDLMPKGYH
jgi:hypothetical protein